MSADQLKRERPPSAPPAPRRKTVHAKPVKTVTEFRLDDDNAQRANTFASLHHVHKAPNDSVTRLLLLYYAIDSTNEDPTADHMTDFCALVS